MAAKRCVHGKANGGYFCKECPGKGICEHGKQKRVCKDCDGTSFCEHGKRKELCKECGGRGFCEHGKQKAQCKRCGGRGFCEHGKFKAMCKECGGSAFCEHGKQKAYCKICCGNVYCEHDKRRSLCKECGGSSLCHTPLCETVGNRKYDGYCLFCYIHTFPDKPVTRNYKTKEFAVVESVKKSCPDVTWVCDKRIVDGCSRRRPDMLCDLGTHIVVVEVDENQHADYECSCENKRLMELSQDVGHRPTVFIRFNPDDYVCDGKTVASCWGINTKGMAVIKKKKQTEWDVRLGVLAEMTQYWLSHIPSKTIEVIELYYDI